MAGKAAAERRGGPTSLSLSRQGVPHMQRSDDQIAAIAKGGYVLRDCDGDPEAIIVATGSEVELAVGAYDALNAKGKKVRVVSMPSTNAFDAQDAAYRESVLPAACTARVSVEAGVTGFWTKYVGLNGKMIGVDTFGESAPAPQVYKHFGVTTDAVTEAVESLL